MKKIVVPVLCLVISFGLAIVCNVMLKFYDFERLTNNRQSYLESVGNLVEESALHSADYDTHNEFYKQIIIASIEEVDKDPYTAGRVFDDSFNSIAPIISNPAEKPAYKISDFRNKFTNTYGHFTDKIKNQETGKMETMMFYYRWVPDPLKIDTTNNYLMVIGVSELFFHNTIFKTFLIIVIFTSFLALLASIISILKSVIDVSMKIENIC
jgi:hypothetical protein